MLSNKLALVLCLASGCLNITKSQQKCVGIFHEIIENNVDFQQHLRGVEEFCDWEASSSFNLSQKLLEMDGSLGPPSGTSWDSVGGSPRRRPPKKWW